MGVRAVRRWASAPTSQGNISDPDSAAGDTGWIFRHRQHYPALFKLERCDDGQRTALHSGLEEPGVLHHQSRL